MSALIGIARFTFAGGDVDEFKRLSDQAMDIVRERDPGTLGYEIYFNEDESEAIVIERYKSSEALMKHAANIGDLMETIPATAGSISGELLGKPSKELEASLADGPVRLFTPYRSL